MKRKMAGNICRPHGTLKAAGRSVDVRAAVRDIEHDQDSPSDGPLLSADESSTFGGRCHFTDVDGHLGAAYPDSQTVDETAHDQHGDVL